MRVRPARVAGDRGYSYPNVRRALSRPGIRALVSYRRDQRLGDRRHRSFDRALYQERNWIERLIGRLKPWRRMAARYEKRATHYLALLTRAAVQLWL